MSELSTVMQMRVKSIYQSINQYATPYSRLEKLLTETDVTKFHCEFCNQRQGSALGHQGAERTKYNILCLMTHIF